MPPDRVSQIDGVVVVHVLDDGRKLRAGVRFQLSLGNLGRLGVILRVRLNGFQLHQIAARQLGNALGGFLRRARAGIIRNQHMALFFLRHADHRQRRQQQRGNQQTCNLFHKKTSFNVFYLHFFIKLSRGGNLISGKSRNLRFLAGLWTES